MERITDLTAIVEYEVFAYADAHHGKARGTFLHDPKQHIYAALVIPDLPRPFPARVIVMARVVGDKVVIEEDTTDKPLYEALMQAGIPREQIILVYAGESLPDSPANE